jgi:hypothetical protein
MADIFISYKREESQTAKKLADALQKKGWTVWWDPEIRAGERYDDVIEKALIESKCVIVLWSKLAVNSQNVKDEASYALNRDKLVPVMIEEVDLPFRFERINTSQLIEWDGSNNFSGFQKLIADIVSILGKPQAEKQKRQQEEAERKPEEELPRLEEEKQKIEEIADGNALHIPDNLLILRTMLRLSERFHLEIIKRYSDNLTVEDIPELKNSLDRIESEARSRGVIDTRKILNLFSEDREVQFKIHHMFNVWNEIRNDEKNGKLDLAIKNKNVDQIKSILKDISKMNGEFLNLAITRMKLLMDYD